MAEKYEPAYLYAKLGKTTYMLQQVERIFAISKMFYMYSYFFLIFCKAAVPLAASELARQVASVFNSDVFVYEMCVCYFTIQQKIIIYEVSIMHVTAVV